MKGSSDWREFWSRESTLFSRKNWSRNMEIFLRNAHPHLNLRPEDRLLDIGCGPGDLEEALSGKVSEIVGVDVSETLIATCRKRLSGHNHIQFHHLGKDPFDYSALRGRPFDKVICLSVVQYLRDLSELDRLIDEVQKLAKPGTRMLIADICLKHSTFNSLISTLRAAFREKYFLSHALFLVRLMFSDYSRLYRKRGLLEFSEEGLAEWLDALSNRYSIKARRIIQPLTLSLNRAHVLLEF